MKFLKQVKAEMAKVVWPSKNKTIFYTVIVILVSVFVAYYMSFFDYVFVHYGVKEILG